MPQAGRQRCPCKPGARAFSSHVQLLSNRFWDADRTILFGRARFFGDRIELTGWWLRGRYRRCLPLVRIACLDYPAHKTGANLSILLDDGEELHLRVDEAHRWRERYEQWFEYDVLPSAKLAGSADKAAAMAG